VLVPMPTYIATQKQSPPLLSEHQGRVTVHHTHPLWNKTSSRIFLAPRWPKLNVTSGMNFVEIKLRQVASSLLAALVSFWVFRLNGFARSLMRDLFVCLITLALGSIQRATSSNGLLALEMVALLSVGLHLLRHDK